MQSTHLREHNLSLVLRSLVGGGAPASRAAIAKSTRLTKPTVSKLMEELIGAGLVQEGAPHAQGTGRPIVPLTPAAGTLIALGLEVAADHIAVLGIDLAGAEVLQRTEYLKITADSVDAAVETAAQLIAEARAAADGVPAVGVCAALPGRISPDGGRVLSAPNLDWVDVPFVERLAAHPLVDGLPVRAENDNRLAVRTEVDRRPGASFLYVRGSTGVGGAVVLEGRVLNGQHGWAGELGHTVVVEDGARCRCGRRGCLEAYVSYHALRERAGLGADVRIDELVDALARSSDRAEVIGTIGRALGLAVANALNVLDLSTVVLSGYLAPIAEEISPVVRATVEAHALAVEAGPVTIARSDAVADPSLRGAARAALEPVLASPSTWISRMS